MNPGEFSLLTSEAIRLRIAEGNEGSYELLFFYGLKLLEERNLGAAEIAFDRCLSLKPDYIYARWYSAKTSFDLGRYECAESSLLNIPADGLYEYDRLLMLGDIYRRMERLEEAKDYYSRAIAIDPKRSHGPHSGLTTLLEKGMELGLAAPKQPLINKQFKVGHPSLGLLCRIRVFARSGGGHVVVFAQEADVQHVGLSATNGVEQLIEFALGDSEEFDLLERETTTWVVLNEKAVFGLAPMRLSLINPVFADGSKKVCVSDVAFAELSHRELEDLTGHRFFWG